METLEGSETKTKKSRSFRATDRDKTEQRVVHFFLKGVSFSGTNNWGGWGGLMGRRYNDSMAVPWSVWV